MARWVMITSGTGLCSGASSPGSCWMTLAMLIPLLAEDLGQPCQHAGSVGDGEAEVIPAADLARGSQDGGRCRFGPEVTQSRGETGPAGDDLDQVADDGRRRRHRAGPSAVEQRIADGIAHHADRVVRSADLGQRACLVGPGSAPPATPVRRPTASPGPAA